LEWLVSTRGRRVAITPREERSGRHRSRADECPSYGRKLGTSQTTLAFSATAPRQTEARPSHDARRNAMGYGQRRVVEGSAGERVRAVANGLRSLQQMVPRRALAEHDGGTRLMSERESVAVGLETDWKIASGFASERDRYAPHSKYTRSADRGAYPLPTMTIRLLTSFALLFSIGTFQHLQAL
jgi:hypothetical protein